MSTRRGRGRVHKKRTMRKNHRQRIQRHKRTLRIDHQQRGGYLSEAIGRAGQPGRWLSELRSAFTHGVLTVSSLDKAVTQVINSKIYMDAAAKKSPESQATQDDALVLQLLEETDQEITNAREVVVDATRKIGNVLKKDIFEDAAAYQQTMDEKLNRPSRIDTTIHKDMWIKELHAAYDSVVAAASRLKNSAIPLLDQVKVDSRNALDEAGWNRELTQELQNTRGEEAAVVGIRNLKDAHERLSQVAKKMASELKKHDIKNFDKKHDTNLRKYLK